MASSDRVFPLLGGESSVDGGTLGDGGEVGALGDLVPVKVGVDGVMGDHMGRAHHHMGGADHMGGAHHHMGGGDHMGGADDHVRGGDHMGGADDHSGGGGDMDVVVGGGHNNGGDMHVVVAGGDDNRGALVGADVGGGTRLVGPGVGREAGGGGEVLAGGAVGGVDVAPAGPRAVGGLAVALDVALGVHEGEGGALATTVGEWRCSLQSPCTLQGRGRGRKEGGGKEDLGMWVKAGL